MQEDLDFSKVLDAIRSKAMAEAEAAMDLAERKTALSASSEVNAVWDSATAKFSAADKGRIRSRYVQDAMERFALRLIDLSEEKPKCMCGCSASQ